MPAPQTATIAFDTAKVRLQLQGSAAGQGIQGSGIMGMVLSIARSEGPLALFKGLTAGLQRQLVYGTLRLGMYQPVRAGSGAAPSCCECNCPLAARGLWRSPCSPRAPRCGTTSPAGMRTV